MSSLETKLEKQGGDDLDIGEMKEDVGGCIVNILNKLLWIEYGFARHREKLWDNKTVAS